MKKIVLIEDDSDLYALLKYNLEKEGFEMAGSKTGKGAIDLCRAFGPDLILLDIMLPDSDGLDICKGIRNHPELAHVPVIFLTARGSETDRIVGLELGASDYVVKPFFVRELIARIKLQFRNLSVPARVLEAGGVELDRTSCQVRLNGTPYEVVGVLPELFVARSGFRVIPVLAWWRRPTPVGPADPAEVAAVERVRIADLADPANRFTVRHPSGLVGPAFRVGGVLVWGFTAGILDRLLALCGWERPWDAERVEELPPSALG